jgi:hypothetical protein
MHSGREIEIDSAHSDSIRVERIRQPLLIAPSVEAGIEALMSSRRRPIDRMCFICLDSGENDPTDKLIGCCTCCFAVAHARCWADWRVAQATHARSSRMNGSRLNADPFICSICKSGEARVHGERVTIRWLESFARFTSSVSHSVRVASGLFSALTGARNENTSLDRGPDADGNDDEADFFDTLEDGGINELPLLIGNVREFFLVNISFVSSVSIIIVLLVRFSDFETSAIVMGTLILLFAYVVSISAYLLMRFQALTNHRRLNVT